MSAEPQDTPITPERIFYAANAFHLTHALVTALELNLFSAVAEGNTDAKQLALRCQASERGCRILCDFLTIHGLLTKNGEQWGLSPEAALFLDRKSPAYLGDTVHFLNAPDMMRSYEELPAAVRKGGTVLHEQGTVTPDNPIWVNFARNMAPMMMGSAMDIAGLLGDGAGAPLKVLDIAAGHGLFGIHIAKSNPQAHIVALDWAAVLEVAKENAARFGVRDRYSTIAGNAFDADFGSGYDLVLLTNFLHHFDRAGCVTLLKKCFAALKPGGRAITLEFIPNEDRVTPPSNAAFALIMLASTPAGDAYTFHELESMCSEAGFASTEMKQLQRSPQRLLISQR
ncbi:MAG: class I SAM-dependent methyltransferase [Bryobacteraceae bacterium]